MLFISLLKSGSFGVRYGGFPLDELTAIWTVIFGSYMSNETGWRFYWIVPSGIGIAGDNSRRFLMVNIECFGECWFEVILLGLAAPSVPLLSFWKFKFEAGLSF